MLRDRLGRLDVGTTPGPVLQDVGIEERGRASAPGLPRQTLYRPICDVLPPVDRDLTVDRIHRHDDGIGKGATDANQELPVTHRATSQERPSRTGIQKLLHTLEVPQA